MSKPSLVLDDICWNSVRLEIVRQLLGASFSLTRLVA